MIIILSFIICIAFIIINRKSKKYQNYDFDITSYNKSIEKAYSEENIDLTSKFYKEALNVIKFVLEDVKENDKNAINNENVITLEKSEYNFTDKSISFAIRPKDYFVDIFPLSHFFGLIILLIFFLIFYHLMNH